MHEIGNSIEIGLDNKINVLVHVTKKFCSRTDFRDSLISAPAQFFCTSFTSALLLVSASSLGWLPSWEQNSCKSSRPHMDSPDHSEQEKFSLPPAMKQKSWVSQ